MLPILPLLIALVAKPATNTYHMPVSWSPVPGATYAVYVSTNAGTEFTRRLSTSSTNLTVSNLYGVRPDIRVVSVNAKGVESDFTPNLSWTARSYWKEVSSDLKAWRRDDSPQYLDPTNAVEFLRIVQSNWTAANSLKPD